MSRPLAANSVRMREKATPVRAKVKALTVEAWLRVAGSLRVSGAPHVRIASPIGTEAVWGAPPATTAEKTNVNVG